MLNFFGVINTLGYGVFTHELMKACDKHVDDICFHPFHGSEYPKDERVNHWVHNLKWFDRKEPSISVFQIPYLHYASGKPLIGFPIFEQEKFSAQEIAILSSMDMIFQPSHWGRRILNAWGIENVHVVHGGYDPEVYHPTMTVEEKLKRIERGGVTFVHIGKYEERKNSKYILQSFVRASHGYKTTLIYHVANPFNTGWFNEVKSYLHLNGFKQIGAMFIKDGVQIIVPRGRFTGSMLRFYRMADFGVWDSHAEGWNLPLMECLACGIPCITNRKTAHSEYITEKYPESLLVNDVINMDLSLKMMAVIANPEKYLNLWTQCHDCVKDFTWESSALAIGRILSARALSQYQPSLTHAREPECTTQ